MHACHLVTCTSGCRSPSIVHPSERSIPPRSTPRFHPAPASRRLLSDSTRSSHPPDSRLSCRVNPPPHGHTVLCVTPSDQLLPRLPRHRHPPERASQPPPSALGTGAMSAQDAAVAVADPAVPNSPEQVKTAWADSSEKENVGLAPSWPLHCIAGSHMLYTEAGC